MPDASTRVGRGRGESKPDWSPDIRARLSQFSIAPSREAEIVEELTQHLDDRWHELMASGMTPDDAARIARTEFNASRFAALLATLRQAPGTKRRRRVRRAHSRSTACSSICVTPSGH